MQERKRKRACKGEREHGSVIKYNFLLQCTAIDGCTMWQEAKKI